MTGPSNRIGPPTPVPKTMSPTDQHVCVTGKLNAVFGRLADVESDDDIIEALDRLS